MTFQHLFRRRTIQINSCLRRKAHCARLATFVKATAESAALPQHPAFLQLPTDRQQQLDAYLDVLLETNQSLNLTAVRDKQEAWQRHVVDSLLLQPVIEDVGAQLGIATQGARVLDVGSGGGLPGMVLAIARPDWHVTMLDSLKKRCAFLDAAICQIGVPNAQSLWSRAEDAGRMEAHRQSYNIVVARAVAELRVLAELCLPFVTVGGLWVAAKGPHPQDEVDAANKALSELGGELHSIVEVDSHASHGSRTVVVVHKVHPTPDKYPRRPGMPGKRPL